ncbi:hypothetical protein EBO15_16560 [Actinomadura harenae]|uniref:Uncharacterized protein n=1 Tax=Actinomadura harenae TaxID=2483351 RepID=A0A3M2M3B0_9ACTN|nr:hypothetical protein [Actinomadura harenae]RMI43293.1 hypothetical protein EBO15_16560 [Actinomadura harenae]
MPVWTHPGCGRPRIWTAQQADAARHARGLPTGGAAPAPYSPGPYGQADWFTFSRVRLGRAVHPLLVVQPGQPNAHGSAGHYADMLSMGLRPVDLHRGRVEDVEAWTVHMDRGRIARITRRGAGAWWVADAGTGIVDGQWRAVGRSRRVVVLLVLPPGWRHLAQLAHRPARQTIPDRLRPLAPTFPSTI